MGTHGDDVYAVSIDVLQNLRCVMAISHVNGDTKSLFLKLRLNPFEIAFGLRNDPELSIRGINSGKGVNKGDSQKVYLRISQSSEVFYLRKDLLGHRRAI
jgi:hypothetical protein